MRKISVFFIWAILAGPALALHFDFGQIEKKASDYTVVVNVKVEVSFGAQTTEIQNRNIGVIASEDGLILFDGAGIDNDNPFSMMSGMTVSAEPKSIEIALMDGKKYPAEFIGIDRYTKLAFCRIKPEEKMKFKYAEFKKRDDFKIGDWLTTYLLMPEFVNPSLGADVGMVSSIFKVPEKFVFIVGFSEMELGSVLYDSTGAPVGVLGKLENPALSSYETSAMMHAISGEGSSIPLLGVVGVDQLEKLINNPPVKGTVTRGWLGIHLQALTPDIADYWGLKTSGGIIINEVVKDSPADSAGLKTGDIIVKLNGKQVDVDKEENIPLFQKQISESSANTSVKFEILRRLNGKVDIMNITAMLTKAPPTPSEAPFYEDKNFELTVRDMVFADYNLYQLNRREFKGVVVKAVEPGGLAAIGEITPGDIIQSIGSDKISSADDAKSIFKKLSDAKPKEAVFFIWRDNKTQFVNVKTDW